jgi:aryl-alcohol dehydrogenase-like predicted oxidoreductase
MTTNTDGLTRREFLAGAAAAAVAGTAITASSADAKLPKRKLGRTGLEVSVIGYGTEFLEAPDVVERLIEGGVNYLDTAPMYQRGGAERKLAPLLKRHRDKLVVATKWYPQKDGPGTKEHFLQSFDESCERMEVEGVDIIQLHDCRTPETVNAPAAYEAFQELKQKGRAKWYGLTTHVSLVKYGSTQFSQPACIRKAVELGWYDTCLAAWNFMSAPEETEALKAAATAGMGVLTMKALKPLTNHDASWCPKFDHEEARKVLKGDNLFQASIRWSLSHDFLSGVMLSMKNFDEVEQNLQAAMTLT